MLVVVWRFCIRRYINHMHLVLRWNKYIFVYYYRSKYISRYISQDWVNTGDRNESSWKRMTGLSLNTVAGDVLVTHGIRYQGSWYWSSFAAIFWFRHHMMTSSNENIFRVTGHLCRGIHRSRWIPHTKASDAELWCFFICVWITGWVNNRAAGDLRRYRAHYDVSAMRRANIHLRYREPKWVMFGTDEETSKYCFSSISIIIRFGQTLMMFVTVICTKLFSALAKLCKMNQSAAEPSAQNLILVL